MTKNLLPAVFLEEGWLETYRNSYLPRVYILEFIFFSFLILGRRVFDRSRANRLGWPTFKKSGFFLNFGGNC